MEDTDDGGNRDSNGEQKEPESKKLRSAEPDLKVLVKYTDDNGNSLERGYLMYSSLLANLSNFVDTCLTVEMKEKTTKEIVFQDVTPDIFDLALHFQDDPFAIRSMTPEDAVKLVEFYDRFDFSGGIKLCDQVLSDYLRQQKAYDNMTPPDNLDLLVEAIAMADKLDLSKCKSDGVDYLNSRFNGTGGSNRIRNRDQHYGPTMFTIEHVKKLHPIFKKKLVDYFPSDMTQEELDSPLFPRYFVEYASHGYSTCNAGTKLWLGKTKCSADGEFSKEDEDFDAKDRALLLKNGRLVNLTIAKSRLCDNDWAILGWESEEWPDAIVLWKCPHSRSLHVPPRKPWIRVHKQARCFGAKPEIAYHSDSFGSSNAAA